MTQTNNERELIEQLAKDSGAESSTWRNGITYHYFTTEQLEAFAKAYKKASDANDESPISQNERQEDVGDGKYAIYFQDNWDGEADKYWTFAFKENGTWKSSETNNDLFQYVGDEILKIVPLYNQLELASPPKQAIPEGWISVKDRLPTISHNAKDFQLASGESDEVLIWMNGYKLATYHVNIDKWSIPFHHGDFRPTHWAELLNKPTNTEVGEWLI